MQKIRAIRAHTKKALAALICAASLLPALSHADNVIRINAPIPLGAGTWTATDPILGPWENTSDLYGCTSSFPAFDYYYTGVEFQQTHSGCSLDQQQTRQNQVVNSKSGDIIPHGDEQTVTQTLRNQSYTTTEVGTSTTYSVIMNAGRYSTTTYGAFVGMYARVDSGVSVGSPVFTPDGDRVMIYFGKGGVIEEDTACTIRLGIAPAAGWTPGATATETSLAFGKKANVLTLFDATGNPSRVYNLDIGGKTSGGGYYRSTTADCADMRAFYNDLGYFTKATLTP